MRVGVDHLKRSLVTSKKLNKKIKNVKGSHNYADEVLTRPKQLSMAATARVIG